MEAYCRHAGRSPARVSTLIWNHGSRYRRIASGCDLTTRSYSRALQWFSDHWPSHPSVPDGFLDQVFAVMARCPRHNFQVLTKRADRMRAYLSPQTDERISRGGPVRRDDHLSLPNVWLGVSVENQDCADERIPVLLATPAAVRFVSVEPVLGPVDLTDVVKLGMERGGGNATTFNALRVLRLHGSPGHPGGLLRDGLDWVIVGGESGPKARRCEVAWIRSVVNGCRERGVPVFVKQLGGLPVEDGQRILLQDPRGGDPSEWPGGLGIREYPEPNHG